MAVTGAWSRAVGVVFAAWSLAACVGPAGGVGEGDPCTQDDCAQDLTCQPIQGRQGEYCCPAPASMSSKPNCQPAPTGDAG
jgi:hypothetical protein